MNYEAHYNTLIERAKIGTPAYERAVEIDGITYRSRTIAAKHLSKDITTIMRWLKNGKAIDKGIA